MGDRRARLIDDGWVEHEACSGGGEVVEFWGPMDDLNRSIYPCRGCFDGLLPPDGMIEAAARALTEKRAGIVGEIEWTASSYFARRSLVEAERWAAKQ